MTGMQGLMNGLPAETESKLPLSPEQQQLDKIARLTYAQVSDVEIGNVVNLTAARISQIKEGDDYKTWYSTIVSEKANDRQETDDSWDKIERLATMRIANHLSWTQDPDYALRAAMVANKAQRRNVLNTPISADAGARTIIQLGGNYITKLQVSNGDGPTVINETRLLDQKQTDLANPKRVEELLGIGKRSEKFTIIEQQLAEAGFQFDKDVE